MKKLTPLIVLGLFLVAVVVMMLGMNNAKSLAQPTQDNRPQIIDSK